MLVLLITGTASMNAQVVIGADRDPSAGAVLELVSSDRGLLLPQVTSAQRSNLNTPGLILFNSSTGQIEFCCKDGQWKAIAENEATEAGVSSTSSHNVVSGVKISDRKSSLEYSKQSVLELETTNKTLILPVVDAINAGGTKGLLAFRMTEGSTGKLYYTLDGTTWLSR